MQPRYKNLLSPIKVGNIVLKNRFVSGNSLPHFLQGPETYPSEQVIQHMVDVAKNGAAIVTFADWTNQDQRNSLNEDGKRFPMYDPNDPSVENYFCQMADQVHYYNSRISIAMMPFVGPNGHDVSTVAQPEEMVSPMNPFYMLLKKSGGKGVVECTHEEIKQVIDETVERVKFYQSMGFDMCTLHFAYRGNFFARWISPLTNIRTDEYGGDIRGRGRFLLELATAIKKACGKNFPIEVQITGSEPGGNTIEEICDLAKYVEDVVDIFQFRAWEGGIAHPVGFNSEQHIYATLDDCAAVKASGTKILCEPIGGYQDVNDAEEILASGKADLIGAARAFFVDPDYYEKIIEGRGEDVYPCVRCNKCHVPSLNDTWLSFCTVNPKLGLAHKLDHFIKPVTRQKNVAVIGGGPAGMRAAIHCAERGHTVTLYEKGKKLGGQLYHTDFASFKWPLRNYRDFLKEQLNKKGVRILLNTEATPELIGAGNYDAIIVAVGAEPITPPIPGVERAWNVMNVFGNEQQLGKKVVVVGGSESGVETAFYLCENGHDVTILSRQNVLAPDATPIHYKEIMQEKWEGMENFHFILQASTTEIREDCVVYRDANGAEQTIPCDAVVALGGMRPKQEESMAFAGLAPEIYYIGDCRQIGSVRECNRTAYAAAMQI
jgi:2,4-dienoyl-CoA reductase-like NADH-dependent reductase (Old Yellow Enzyme family)/thioredoxin reductase